MIAFDYLFITKEKVLMREELDAEEEKNVVLKVLVVKDTKAEPYLPTRCGRKGSMKMAMQLLVLLKT